MGDSAELLFKIGANADDAAANLTRFRGLLGTNLNAMGAEFDTWSKKVFGSLGTVQGAMTAGIAALAAGVTAAAAYATDAAHKYEEYVGTIAKGSKTMQVSAENASVLHYATTRVGGDFEAVAKSISIFEANVVKANSGSKQQLEFFDRLGISRAQLQAGEKNLIPLLGQVGDAWKHLSSGVERAGIAREGFSRGWSEMAGILKLGEDGFKRLAAEAAEAGRIVTAQDIEAVKRYKLAQRELKEQQEALDLDIGRRTLPLMEKVRIGYAALAETLLGKGMKTNAGFWADFIGTFGLIQGRINDTLKSLKVVGDGTSLKPPGTDTEKIKEATQDWYGLSTLLESVKGKLAGVTSEEAKNAQEIEHLRFELGKTKEEYEKLAAAGKLTAESRAREAKQTAEIETSIAQLQVRQAQALEEKKRLAMEQAEAELRERLDAQMTQTGAMALQHWEDEIGKLRAANNKKGAEYARLNGLIDQIEATGRQKLERESLDTYQVELEQLQQFLGQVISSRMTAQERIDYQYELDLQKFSEVELQKKLIAARNPAEAAAIEAQFALNREAMLQKYGADLVALQNSQGWNGVFGGRFAQLLAHDENALREWASSADQAFAMVGLRAVAMEGLGRKAFDTFAQGMGTNIAQAIIYEKSIGKAMRSALASTLESIAAESMVQAIYATALGFLRLAHHDYPGAAAAFTSAATFGAVGGVAAVAGRLIAPKDASTTSVPGGAAAGTGGAGSAGGGAAEAKPAVMVNIHVAGNIYRDTAALIDAINEGVERGLTLTATNTQTATVVYR